MKFGMNGAVVGTAPIKGAPQKVFSMSLQPHFLYHLHFPTTAGHPGEKRMYDSMPKEYFWPHTASDGYTAARDCIQCYHNKRSGTRRRSLQLFLPSGPLEIVAMDIQGPLWKTLNGSS